MTKRIIKLKFTRRTSLELPAVYLHCPQCRRDVVVIKPEQAMALVRVDGMTFQPLVAAPRVQTFKTVTGGLLVCAASLVE